jgi:hypothetical protein
MQVKIFKEEPSVNKLETELNSWLFGMQGLEVEDIQFQMASSTEGYPLFSAMVIFEVLENVNEGENDQGQEENKKAK